MDGTNKNVCTHKSFYDGVYSDVTACAGYGSNKSTCEANSKCNFLFYQEPLTNVASENTCTHLPTFNNNEASVSTC